MAQFRYDPTGVNSGIPSAVDDPVIVENAHGQTKSDVLARFSGWTLICEIVCVFDGLTMQSAVNIMNSDNVGQIYLAEPVTVDKAVVYHIWETDANILVSGILWEHFGVCYESRSHCVPEYGTGLITVTSQRKSLRTYVRH